ncbi:hypothetical protein EDC45_1497 [Mesocricetibacter intestinalis]|uniref:Uncharacterized protein n=1 Tax=Mesocricetibacter intestinalis TaxID=1521930 RepID=A0A4R6V7U9_9PAST|nr:hypothetical protein [Mesocricetibacter intestinalis]TDQ57436.1 hypothetical protein EDC45_1497 [Mesocricetibacter intestinalis]
MKGLFTIVFIGALTCSAANAKPVNSFAQAVDKVIASIEKNQLSPLKTECLIFMESEVNDIYYFVDVREKHDEKCGGAPYTAPRLMSYEVNKKTGELCTDSIVWAERSGAEDPYAFVCNPIN